VVHARPLEIEDIGKDRQAIIITRFPIR